MSDSDSDIDVPTEEELEEESLNDLRNGVVVDKYKAAADVCNRALAHVVAACSVGAKVVDLCQMGDDFINEEVAKSYKNKKGLDKGVAFPTCVSVNNCCDAFSPLPFDSTVLAEGDVVKVNLGVHIDGYICNGAHTLIATATPTEAVKGRKADVICAAHFGAEAALRMLRPGTKNSAITETLQAVASAFNCNVVQNVVSSQNKRFVVDANKCILSKTTLDAKVEDCVIEENDVFSIDIVMTTGEGLPKETPDSRTTVYKRQVDMNYNLKMKSARYVFSEVNKRFPTFPFTIRALGDKKGRLGITELLQHDLVTAYPVLYEKEGEYVAQFKFTALVLPGSINKLTETPPLPFVSSDLKIEDAKVNQILSMGLKRKKKNKKRKKKKPAAKPAAQ